MLHRVWLALLSGHLATLLSLHRLTGLYWDGLTELSWYGGTLLPGNLLTVLPGNIDALLLRNIYAVSLRDLLTSLPLYWPTFLLSNRLAGLLRDILAMFFFHRPTFLSGNFSCNFGAVRFWHSVAFSLSCWLALLVRHFSASWFGRFTDLSRYLGATWTWCMWKSGQGSEAKRRMVVTVAVAVISRLAVTLFLSRCLSFSLAEPVVTPGVWRARGRIPARRADSLLDCPTVRLHWITLLNVSDGTLL